MYDSAETGIENPREAAAVVKKLSQSCRDLIGMGKRSEQMLVQFVKAHQLFHDNERGRVLSQSECPKSIDFFIRAFQPGTLIFFNATNFQIAFTDCDQRSIRWPNKEMWTNVPNVTTPADFQKIISFFSVMSGLEVDTRVELSVNSDCVIMEVTDRPRK